MSSSRSQESHGVSSTRPVSVVAVREASGHEYYASLRTSTALEKAEVAVVLLEANVPLAEQDIRILQMVIESAARSCWPSTSGT